MDEGKLVLDKLSFSALAVDSRVNILKALRERRKTLSELSDELKLSISSTKEHLQKLEDAQLIKKMDEGRKWKYYELTRKGEQIVSPNTEVRVWILLAISAVAFIYSALLMYSPLASAPMEATNAPQAVMDSAKTVAFDQNVSVGAVPIADAPKEALTSQATAMNPADYLPLIILIVSGLIILSGIIYLIWKRSSTA